MNSLISNCVALCSLLSFSLISFWFFPHNFINFYVFYPPPTSFSFLHNTPYHSTTINGRANSFHFILHPRNTHFQRFTTSKKSSRKNTRQCWRSKRSSSKKLTQLCPTYLHTRRLTTHCVERGARVLHFFLLCLFSRAFSPIFPSLLSISPLIFENFQSFVVISTGTSTLGLGWGDREWKNEEHIDDDDDDDKKESNNESINIEQKIFSFNKVYPSEVRLKLFYMRVVLE